MSVVLSSIRHAEGAGTDAKGRRAVVDAFFGQKGRRSVLGTYDIDRYGDTTLPDYGGTSPWAAGSSSTGCSRSRRDRVATNGRSAYRYPSSTQP